MISFLSSTGTAFAWGRHHRVTIPATPSTTPATRPTSANPSPGVVPQAMPTVPHETVCDGMGELTSHQAERHAGLILQNLTHHGMSLADVPNAYQGHRLRFGSCSTAAALTQINGYAQSRHVLPAEISQPPFYRLGTLTPRRRALIFRTVGEADQAVEDNFVECHSQFAASAEGMAQCLTQKLSQLTCMDPADLHYVPCPAPKVATFEGSLAARRTFLRKHFEQSDASRIVPLTFPWDTRLVLGPPQASDADVKFEHVSAVIGRRWTPQGHCDVLVRNSWGTCSHWLQEYAIGACDNKGKTDDVWVDSESFLKRSGEFTYLQD